MYLFTTNLSITIYYFSAWNVNKCKHLLINLSLKYDTPSHTRDFYAMVTRVNSGIRDQLVRGSVNPLPELILIMKELCFKISIYVISINKIISFFALKKYGHWNGHLVFSKFIIDQKCIYCRTHKIRNLSRTGIFKYE